ncbi:unnamed protein product [Cyberlindnera jadinii]|uniref:K Homology domain-containing protein n=1 Tax=Cyberlindnera jadinii (strain ATCC 18201 / CBS 1600 / BCRC 20928 / JCM 3617 / NBRC 0987 / NRRL Y-1542) TaxID=983966 RepID=A0A0H5C486_CYBJN|nr:unnamed protein product [Cyberlindnera jadinii]
MSQQDTSETTFEGEFAPGGENAAAGEILPSTEPTSAIIGVRILVTVKEAGVIIGKNGSIIADIRERTNVKAGVSPVIQGTPDRILTVTGALDDTAEALGLIAQALLENPLDESALQFFPLKRLLPPGPEGTTTLRLLVPNAQMGTIIGKQGVRIKEIQQRFNVKIVASKDFLHNSTERLVELQGSPAAIEDASRILARCLMEDWHSVTGTSFYTPSPRPHPGRRYVHQHGGDSSDVSFDNEYSKTARFPRDYVGCLIGKAGSRIQEIRRVSGAQIIIAPEDDEDGFRQFVLTGSTRAIDKAMSFLKLNMEREQERRAKLSQEQE